jgi:DNA repair protein RecO (recombination protein O)
MSKRGQRVTDAAGYLLHAAAWRETSQIVQVFTRDYGTIALVAKGAKRPYSALRSILHAFHPLLLCWTGGGEVRTLTRAELAGALPMRGRAFMSAWYMNELVLRLLPREDPHPELFDAYQSALHHLAFEQPAANALRRFEWVLLAQTGYGLAGPMPDFNDPSLEPALRVSLRERLDALLERPLQTRRVLMELQRF